MQEQKESSVSPNTLRATLRQNVCFMNRQAKIFVDTVWQYYDEYGRHELPWRHTTNPYRILVSEVMLQQTQVARVEGKYREFLHAFPTTKALAQAALRDVLQVWQGLGYNRRAKLLQQAACIVHDTRRGRWPRTYDTLRALPGVGPYTAGAVLAFAYNEGVPMIETNIRAVYLHHFFRDATDVPDSHILPIVAQTLPVGRSREWYWALMDYGVHVKTTYQNPSRRARAHVQQSTFVGSDRQLRGLIIRVLLAHPSGLTKNGLARICQEFTHERIQTQLSALTVEGMVTRRGQRYVVS